MFQYRAAVGQQHREEILFLAVRHVDARGHNLERKLFTMLVEAQVLPAPLLLFFSTRGTWGRNQRSTELEGTRQDHRVQLLAPLRTSQKSDCASDWSKGSLNSVSSVL